MTGGWIIPLFLCQFKVLQLILVPIQGLAAKFLLSMIEYPPSQSPGAFNLSKIEEMLKSAGGSK